MPELKSVDLIDFKFTLTNWIKKDPMPLKLKAMLLKEVYEEINKEADEEIYQQCLEREEKEDVESNS